MMRTRLWRVALLFVSFGVFAQKPCGFKDGLQEGECKVFHDNGQVSEIANWEKGKLEGRTTLFYRNGNKEAEGLYKKNFKIGTWFYYYQNGKLKAKEKYVYRNHMSALEGEYLSYYENGQLKIKSYYKRGKRNGDFTAYSENGMLLNQGKMKDDACDLFRIYDSEGVLSSEGKLDNEFKKVGIWVEYAEDGKTKFSEGVYAGEQEKPHGKWTYYEKDGKTIKKVVTYNYGDEVSVEQQ